MPFTPISLPIQQILMTDFVTDIATITNSNALLLQAKLEDLINDLEIDISNKSIGTDSAINYIKAQSVIIEDTSLIFQTGSPSPTIIASLTKNISNESIFQVDRLITNIDASFDIISVNDLTINTLSTFDGDSVFNASVTINSSFIESKESINQTLTWDGTPGQPATTTVVLSNTSKQNIFITLKATDSGANPVYSGGSIDSDISEFKINFNFDLTNPPAPNTKFTVYIVDFLANTSLISLTTAVATAAIPIKLVGLTNLSTSNSIITHDGSSNVGLNSSSDFTQYLNVTFNYILDANNDDRIVVTSLVGAELF